MTVLSSTSLPASSIKVRWLEPYVSAALNQKSVGVQPKGVFTGFNVVPFGAFGISVQVDPALGISGANVLETTGAKYSVTLIQDANVAIDLAPFFSTTVYIVLDVQYATNVASTAQIKVVDAAELGTNPDLVLLAKVNVPGIGPVLTTHINMGYRLLAGDSITDESRPALNLLPNGTFERDIPLSAPAGWTSSGGGLVLSVDNTVSRSAPNSMKLVAAAPVTLNADSQRFSVTPGIKYRIGGWIRSSGGDPIAGPGSGVSLQYQWQDATGATVGGLGIVEGAFLGGSAVFEQRKWEEVAPATAATAFFRIRYVNVQGTLYADDLEFSARRWDDAVAGGGNYAGGVNWADGTTNPATTLEGQLDKILTDLAGVNGAPKIGNAPSKILANVFTMANGFQEGIEITATKPVKWLTDNWIFKTNGSSIFEFDQKDFSDTVGAIPFRFRVDLAGDAAELTFDDSVTTGYVGTSFGGSYGPVFTGMGIGTHNAQPLIFAPNNTIAWQMTSTGVLESVGGPRAIKEVLDPVNPQDAATKNYVDAKQAFQNFAINGRFDFWQRRFFNSLPAAPATGIGGVFTNQRIYVTDRWYLFNQASNVLTAPSCEMRRFSSGPERTPVVARVHRLPGEVGTASIGIAQEIDRDFVQLSRGQVVQITASIRTGADWTGSVACQLITGNTGTSQIFYDPSTTNSSGYTGTTASPISVFVGTGTPGAATFTEIFQTATIPIPIDASNMVLLFRKAGSVGAAGANDWFEITGISLTIASGASTPFRLSGGTIAGELTACQRFFEKSYPIITPPGTGLATTGYEKFENNNLPAQLLPGVRFTVRKRVTPAIAFYTPATGTAGSWDETLSPGAYPITANGIADTGFYATQGSIGVGGNWQGHWTADAEI